MEHSLIVLNGKYAAKQAAREKLFSEQGGGDLIDYIRSLDEIFPLARLDRKVKHGHSLSYDEARMGMLYVLAATNSTALKEFRVRYERCNLGDFDHSRAIAMGAGFLQLMATKESLDSLSPEEIAGLIATSYLDVAVKPYFGEKVFEICGMGGDKGFSQNGESCKTINVSTLSALTMAALGYPTTKHGSYANTSAVGSTEAIEIFGASTCHDSIGDIEELFKLTAFFFSDAHLCKTLHDLSHYLRFETVNHVIGPMTVPLSLKTMLFKVMGVNEKVHPQTIIEAYSILNKKGITNACNIAVVTGLDRIVTDCNAIISHPETLKEFVLLDELSPYSSVVSFLVDGEVFGTCILTPADFGITLNADKLMVPNNRNDLIEANFEVLTGENEENMKYLAMNVALCIFVYKCNKTSEYFEDGAPKKMLLREYYKQAYDCIMNGHVIKKLKRYVGASIPVECD